MPSPEMLGRFAEVLQEPLEPLLWLWVEQHMDLEKARRILAWFDAALGPAERAGGCEE